MIVGLIIGIAGLVIAAAIFFLADNEFLAMIVAALAVVTIGISSSAGLAYYNPRTLECTVVDKDRGYNRDSGSEYRVYTEQCGTFVNQDSLFRGKFNSGDIQGQLQVGETYILEVAGPRVPFLSMFPNIFEVRPVS